MKPVPAKVEVMIYRKETTCTIEVVGEPTMPIFREFHHSNNTRRAAKM